MAYKKENFTKTRPSPDSAWQTYAYLDSKGTRTFIDVWDKRVIRTEFNRFDYRVCVHARTSKAELLDKYTQNATHRAIAKHFDLTLPKAAA